MIALIRNNIAKLMKRGSICYLSVSKFVSGNNISVINSFNSKDILQETNSTKFLWTERMFENPNIGNDLKTIYEHNTGSIDQIKNFLEMESGVINIISDNKIDTFNWLIALLEDLNLNGYVVDNIEQINDYINSSENGLILLSEGFYHAFRCSYFANKKKGKIIIVSDDEIRNVTNIILSKTIQKNPYPSFNSI